MTYPSVLIPSTLDVSDWSSWTPKQGAEFFRVLMSAAPRRASRLAREWRLDLLGDPEQTLEGAGELAASIFRQPEFTLVIPAGSRTIVKGGRECVLPHKSYRVLTAPGIGLAVDMGLLLAHTILAHASIEWEYFVNVGPKSMLGRSAPALIRANVESPLPLLVLSISFAAGAACADRSNRDAPGQWAAIYRSACDPAQWCMAPGQPSIRALVPSVPMGHTVGW